MSEQPENSYKDAITELESIVEKLQSNTCEVDQMVQLTRRASSLLKFCRDRLTTTEDELRTILAQLQDDPTADA